MVEVNLELKLWKRLDSDLQATLKGIPDPAQALLKTVTAHMPLCVRRNL